MVKFKISAQILTYLLLFAVSCAHNEKSMESSGRIARAKVESQKVELKKPISNSDDDLALDPHPKLSGPPIELKLILNRERTEVSNNCNVSKIKAFDNDQILRKKIQSVEFKVKAKTSPTGKPAQFKQVQETFFKDGSTPLHELAFPELGEKIEFTFAPDMRVIKVEGYPERSIFTVQPLPLPSKPVRLGEEWINESHWVTGESAIELHSKIKSKFSSWRSCGDHQCAEIKIQGQIRSDRGFGHTITGLFLMEPKTGLVPFAEFRAYEQMQVGEARAEVHSVLRSILALPPGYYKASREELICPSEKMEE